MSKSYKRNNKYNDDENYRYDSYNSRQNHLKEKRLRSALRSRNQNDLMNLFEED
jgi:hypothetical protein